MAHLATPSPEKKGPGSAMKSNDRNREPLEGLPKSLAEIRRIAREQNAGQVPLLSLRELEVLYYELNRIRYPLEEQEEFIRFYMVVHDTLVKCRS